MMNKKALLLLLTTLAFGVAPFVTPPFTGYDPSLFPVQIERPSIQPAGYAFAIWSVIYLWLIAHAVFGLWKRPDSAAWDVVRLPLALAVGVGLAVHRRGQRHLGHGDDLDHGRGCDPCLSARRPEC